ncbi:Dihydrolipoamide acetyltransferase [Minicystis rosea]|nr:Dihydrolipoamide acetyltransferase [Minicystis rosea]
MKLTPLLASLLSAALLLGPRGAAAQDKTDQGRVHFTNAVALYREGDYRNALIEFRRAYEISGNYRALYNIGQTEFELQNYAGALRSFQAYLAQGGADIEPERRALVEGDIRKLNARVAKVTIRTNVAGADVLIDDVVVGQSPLREPVLASAGRRKITVQKGELIPVTRVLDVPGGEAVTVSIPLPIAAAPGPATAEPPPPPAPSRTGVWVSLAITSGLVAGAVTTGVLAILSRSDTETKLGMHGVTAEQITAAHDKTKTLGIVTDVLGGAALAMGVTTIVLGATSGKPDAAAKPKVSLQIDLRGARLFGQF